MCENAKIQAYRGARLINVSSSDRDRGNNRWNTRESLLTVFAFVHVTGAMLPGARDRYSLNLCKGYPLNPIYHSSDDGQRAIQVVVAGDVGLTQSGSYFHKVLSPSVKRNSGFPHFASLFISFPYFYLLFFGILLLVLGCQASTS